LKPSLRTGYAAGLTSAPTSIGGTVLSTFRYPRGTYPATESPTAQNIEVLCGTDGSAGKHYFQRPFWKNNAGTIDSSNWLNWKEYVITTMTKTDSTHFSLGVSAVADDYYNGWLIRNITQGAGEVEFVLDYVNSTNTIQTLGAMTGDWVSTDTVVLYRFFHDNPYDNTHETGGFNPSWTDPIVLKVGNNIVTSGGQGPTVGYKPIWSGYVNQTWFAGSGLAPVYQQTYVCELELKNTGTWLSSNSPPTASAETSLPLTDGKRYWVGYVWETFDGQRSNLITSATPYLTMGTDEKLDDTMSVNYYRMDKRARWLHVFVAETDASISTEPDWAEWFFIETHDMTSTGWTSAGLGVWTKALDITSGDWNSAGSDLKTFLGHTKPNRTTVSFSYGLVTAGRLFVAKYYDYNASLNYNDSINYTPFAGNGVAQWAKIMDLDDQTQSTIESGDPASIQGLAVQDGRLIILKDTSSFYIDTTYDPVQWILSDISRRVGCDAPDSVVVTPFGTIWAKSGDGIYLWRGADPIEISRNWRVASDDGSTNLGFRGLTTTYKTQWQGWYDTFYRSYRLMYTSDGSALKTLYEAFLDVQDEKLQGLPIWTKHTLAHNCGHVLVRSDNVIYFSDDSTKTYYFSTATDDAGTDIRPYFHTGLYALTEKDIATIVGFDLSVYQTGTGEAAKTLDFIVYIDGVAQNTFADNTYTATRFSSKLPLLGTSNRNRNGRTVAFAFNTNASPRGLGTAYRIEQLSIEYEVKKRAFSQSL